LKLVAAGPTCLRVDTQSANEQIVLTLGLGNCPYCPNVEAGCAFVDLVLVESPSRVVSKTPSRSRTELTFRTVTLRVVGGR